MRGTALVGSIVVALLGCASSGAPADPDAAVPQGDGGDVGPDGGADAGPSGMCPAGQLAVNVTAAGDVVCAAIDDDAAVAVRSRCSVYSGHRDSCDGCADPPAKWSQSSPLSCSPGVGAGNACVDATLDDPVTPVELATVDLVGDVNGDDKLYTTLHCIAAPRDPVPAPCAPGWAIQGRAGDTWMCAPLSEAVVAYVGARCSIYLGWQDSCDGCTTPPSKWGHASDGGCASGAGADNTCTTTTLGGEEVHLFGLNTDGDLDGNDKLHVGLSCDVPEDGGSTSTTVCPAGQFVVATGPDDTFTCADPAAVFAGYVRDRCTLFLGWRDSCDGCTAPPTKWGKVSTESCQNGAGADNTCSAPSLGGTTVQLFGLSTDGDVNSDDTLYVGFRCEP